MKFSAYISGAAEWAVIKDENGRWYKIHAEEPDRVLRAAPGECGFIFESCSDIQHFTHIDIAEVQERLLNALYEADALKYVLIALNGVRSDSLRHDALEGLEDLLANEPVEAFLKGVLFAERLPADAALAGAIALSQNAGLLRVKALLTDLKEYQKEIGVVRDCWKAIPDGLFGGKENRQAFQAAAVRGGLFYQYSYMLRTSGINIGLSIPSENRAEIREFHFATNALIQWKSRMLTPNHAESWKSAFTLTGSGNMAFDLMPPRNIVQQRNSFQPAYKYK